MSAQSDTAMRIEEILSCLPHRYPFLMIDKVIRWEAKKSLLAIKNVTINEPCFTGHFPGKPIFPGVLLIEALAQAAGILAFKTFYPNHRLDGKDLLLLVGIDKARFKRPVEPGDQLLLEVKLLSSRRNFAVFQAEASVGDELVGAAELLTAFKRTANEV